LPEIALCVCVVKNINTNTEQASNEVSQTLHYRAQGQMYHRVLHDGNWSSWSRIDNFGCKTLAELKAALANA